MARASAVPPALTAAETKKLSIKAHKLEKEITTLKSLLNMGKITQVEYEEKAAKAMAK